MADEASDLRRLPAGTAHCLLEDVVSYRAGELEAERARDFEEHLRMCAACQRLVRDAATVLGGVDFLVQAAGSRFGDVDQLLARLRGKVAERSARFSSRPRQPSQRFWLPMVGVAAVVLLVAVLQLVMVMLPRVWKQHPAAVPAAVPGSAVGPAAPHAP